jgi:hydroxyacylglutathione hydrolase
VDPNNSELRSRLEVVTRARSSQQPTIPTSLALELQTNPFLRPDSPAIRAMLDMDDGSEDAKVFGALRAHKEALGGFMGWVTMVGYPLASYFGFV